MRLSKLTMATALLAMCSLGASAQSNGSAYENQTLDYKPYPYGFVQLQGGAGTTFTNKQNITDLVSPYVGVGAGAFFSPVVGARLHVSGWESKGGFRSIENTYKFNYLNTNLDMMFNLSNLFCPSRLHTLNFVLVGGFGLNYAWGNDDFDAIMTNGPQPTEATSLSWGKTSKTRDNDLLGHSFRVGMLADVNLSKHWNVGVEVDLNSLDDRFNSKTNNRDDYMLTGAVSLTYKFGHKKRPVETPVVPVVKETPAPAPVKVVEQAKPVPVKLEPYKYVCTYAQPSETDLANEDVLNTAAEWCKKNPTKSIILSGYADKQTGNPSLNMKLSKERAQKVADILQKKGVSASQIEIKAYGDTVQPFAENDKNRCVIIESK